MLSLSKRQRQLIVLHLSLVSLANLHGFDGAILCRQPGSLDISRLLRITARENLTSESGDALDTLLLKCSHLREASLLVLRVAESLLSRHGRYWLRSAEEDAVRGFLVDFIVVSWVHIDDSAEPSIGALYGTVNEGQLGDVVLVDHV